jgi:CTP:molybdopterin cytidylyltransferase MocA
MHNQQWQEGMASSIRAGVNAAPGADGILLMTCDQPAVTAAHLRTLIAADRVCASAYSGRRGVPAYFPAALFPDLLRLTGDTGARGLLQDAPAIELAGGDLDVDTGEQLSHARELFG